VVVKLNLSFVFQSCYSERCTATTNNNASSSSAPKDYQDDANEANHHHQRNHSRPADARQFDVLQRQFDQASKHLKNHADELATKILQVNQY